MKVFVVVFALCIASTLGQQNSERNAKLQAHRDICMKETGLDAVSLENAKNGQTTESDEKLNCFITCVFKRIGVMDADGNINAELSIAEAPTELSREQATKIVNECKVLKGNTVCETGGLIFNCFAKSNAISIL